jgi:non-homologous end joining protein Ku
MDIKQKFESIDQSKLSGEINTVLNAMKRKSKNFTSQKHNDIFEPQLDKIISGLTKKHPKAINTKPQNPEPNTTSKSKIEDALNNFNKIADQSRSFRNF